MVLFLKEDLSDKLLSIAIFGWEGVADGYYYDGIFDLSKGPVMPEDSDAGTPASRYYKDLSIFTYTLVL